MVNLSLQQSGIVCGTNESFSKTSLPIRNNCGLLYPSESARVLSELSVDEFPSQLIILDGTWSQARTMVRDIRQLDLLPHFKLAPTQPGQYRIRLEPDDISLSTVEAAVESLRELEPQTQGLDQLLAAFGAMVQKQLDHPKVGRHHYSGGPKSGRTINVPSQLLQDGSSIVVVYGESAYRDPLNLGSGETDTLPRSPIVWVAERLDTGERFSCRIRPEVGLTDSFLAHLKLNRDQFDSAISISDFAASWNDFLKEDDVVVSYAGRMLQLLNCIDSVPSQALTLKSINYDENSVRRPLGEFLDSKNVSRCYDGELGRAGERLSNSIALIKYLRKVLANGYRS